MGKLDTHVNSTICGDATEICNHITRFSRYLRGTHTHTSLLACHSNQLTIPSFGFLTTERYPRRTISLSPAAITSDSVRLVLGSEVG